MCFYLVVNKRPFKSAIDMLYLGQSIYSKFLKHTRMIYAYVRVSTEHQSVENQRFEIDNFCSMHKLSIGRWVMETVSGAREVKYRKLGHLLNRMRKDDILICAEISRLGRNLLMIMGILNDCMSRDIRVWTIKDNFKLGNDISSKVLAFAFALSAEIERNLISQRTKEALQRKKSEGIKLGRPSGRANNKKKLSGKEHLIISLLQQEKSYSDIGKQFKVHPRTVMAFVKGLT